MKVNFYGPAWQFHEQQTGALLAVGLPLDPGYQQPARKLGKLEAGGTRRENSSGDCEDHENIIQPGHEIFSASRKETHRGL